MLCRQRCDLRSVRASVGFQKGDLRVPLVPLSGRAFMTFKVAVSRNSKG